MSILVGHIVEFVPLERFARREWPWQQLRTLKAQITTTPIRKRMGSGEEEMGSGEEDGKDLPSDANSLDRDTSGRKRRKIHCPLAKQPLISPKPPRKHAIGMKRKLAKYKRGQWSDEALKLAIEALDHAHKLNEVCQKYGIPRSSLRDHVKGRTKTRKMGPNTILTQEEKCQFIDYIQMMVLWGHPMTPSQLKSKVAEITQSRITSFKNGIPRDSWVKYFRDRHPDLVLRVLQGLDYKRAKTFNQQTMAQFYTNLENLYNKHHYEPQCIWNIDETGC